MKTIKKHNLMKEKKIQYITALTLLFGSFVLTVAGFIVPPTGEISSSVLYFFAQCLFFTGAVFGLNLMVKNSVERFFRKHKDAVTDETADIESFTTADAGQEEIDS